MITFPLLGKSGRLGNQLWQIASTIGIARSRDEQVSLPDWVYRPYFSLPDELFTDAEGTDAATLVPQLDQRCAIYLQDFSLWSAVEDEIWAYLAPSNLAVEHLSQYEWFAAILDRPCVSVHVRRGDNAFDPATPDKHLYHPLRSPSYYRAAIDTLPADMEAIIFSDDLPWCREHMPAILDRPCHFFEGGTSRPKEHEPEYATAPVTDWIDLLAMGAVRHHILSNSTYAFWGAFLSCDPHPLYPSNWCGPLLDYVDTSRMFPPSWVQIHDETSRV